MTAPSDPTPRRPGPITGVSIVVERDGRVLLVKRGNRLSFGLWSLPGGHVEPGEPHEEAALRELMEETAVSAEISGLLDTIDIVNRDPAGAIANHYMISVFGARWMSGEGAAGDDASDVMWASVEALAGLSMTPGTADFLARILTR